MDHFRDRERADRISRTPVLEPAQAVERVQHYRRPSERPLTRAARGQVTILFGGLTLPHEALIQAGMEGLGYRVQRLPTPTKADCQIGKEYCNPGQCNPNYFTVGTLINYLKQLQEEAGADGRGDRGAVRVHDGGLVRAVPVRDVRVGISAGRWRTQGSRASGCWCSSRGPG